MIHVDEHETVLPQLESRLRTAATRRARPKPRWRRAPVILCASLALTASAAAASVTGFLSTVVSTGNSDHGAYVIGTKDSQGTVYGGICLQLRVAGGGPAYGCGRAPSTERPFGLVVADSLDSTDERVIYGLVSSAADTVRVLGKGTAYTVAPTSTKPGLPGRFFKSKVANTGRIELVAIAKDGSVIGHIGSRTTPTHPAASHDEAIAQGDPAGFGPAVSLPSSFTYEGKQIDPDDAARRGLICAQDRQGVRCTNP